MNRCMQKSATRIENIHFHNLVNLLGTHETEPNWFQQNAMSQPWHNRDPPQPHSLRQGCFHPGSWVYLALSHQGSVHSPIIGGMTCQTSADQLVLFPLLPTDQNMQLRSRFSHLKDFSELLVTSSHIPPLGSSQNYGIWSIGSVFLGIGLSNSFILWMRSREEESLTQDHTGH